MQNWFQNRIMWSKNASETAQNHATLPSKQQKKFVKLVAK